MNWRKETRRVLRRHARRLAVESLCRIALTERNWRRADDVPKVQVLLMHDLHEGERDRFRELLRQLATRYDLIPYSEAVRRITTGAIDRSYLAFSFDDGLHGCWAAAKILEEFGTRGMFFVCPKIIEANKKQQSKFCRERLWMGPRSFLSWSEIAKMSDLGHEFGSHTMNHVFVDRVNREQLAEELGDSKRMLEKSVGTCDHFAWPYGRFSHFNEQSQHVASRLGFISAASGERGSHAAHSSPVRFMPCIRRESVEVRWPFRHVKYFLNRSGRSPRQPSDSWPSQWRLISRSRVLPSEHAA